MKNKAVMILGTASDVGKSIICTGLCRIFKQDGYRVSPFKAQNMALNSYITLDGQEIGRSQGIQAEAAGVTAEVNMNPILLKPTGEMHSQVVVLGRPLKNMSASSYRSEFLTTAQQIVQKAMAEVQSRHDLMIMEGAGSPVEVNLKDKDIVNMRAAEMADAPVILVADIDRGGVFAAIVGTLTLLTDSERDRVKGIIINKFRGDVALLEPGVKWLENYTGKPVLGVVPYLKNIAIDAEDSVVLSSIKHGYGDFAEVQIAVIHLPLISNFTDIDALHQEPGCNIYFVSSLNQFGSPDLVIIPGSKNTLADMLYLQQTGLSARIKAYAAAGGLVVGICGGLQMLGMSISDPMAVESSLQQIDGIGILPLNTTFQSNKLTTRSEACLEAGTLPYVNKQLTVQGYEIHMGRSEVAADSSLMRVVRRSNLAVNEADGAVADGGRVWGTYFHGIFDNGFLRRELINYIRTQKGLNRLTEPVYDKQLAQEQAFDKLAAHLRKHLDLEKLNEIVGL